MSAFANAVTLELPAPDLGRKQRVLERRTVQDPKPGPTAKKLDTP